MSGRDQVERGRELGSMGKGYLHNIPFIHRTKQTSTESLLRLEVGSMGKGGRNRFASRGVVKKNTGPLQNWGARGREDLVCFNPRGIRRSKAVREGQNRQGWREKEGPGGGGLFGNWVKGLPSPCWDPSSPSGLAEGGSLQPPTGRSGAARCSRQGAGGGSQRLALQGDDSTAPQLLRQSAAVLDLLVAVCL